ncbi:hypothetical protein POCGH01_00205200 [Plasmodium ovale]|uniref:PIR protein n=1 Tax=Plasmodium ovale TaxID=36330 RepID=A0A1D3JF65_PLAOA|nr:hypothetical protein POCGH01_00205200 [Plasmodium ovale]
MKITELAFYYSLDDDKSIQYIWNKLEQLHDNSKTKYNWDNEKYSNSFVNMRRYLDKFCSIKEYSAAPQDIKSEETCTSSENAPRPEEESLTEITAENTLRNYPSVGIFLSSAITHLVTVLVFFILCRVKN